MHHDVDEVEERPATGTDSFDMMGPSTPGLDRLQGPLRQRADVGIRRARGDHEEIGGIAHAAQIENEDVYRLVLLECTDGKPELPASLRCYRFVADGDGNGSPVREGAGSSIW